MPDHRRLAEEAREREREELASASREMTAARRDELAHVRDVASDNRDRFAQTRDDAVDARDRAAQERERQLSDAELPRALLDGLRELRQQGATLRHQSALDRLRAAADRDAAAEDRRHAAREREHAGTDELTGVLRRGAGETALSQEIERARRGSRELMLAIIDVDGLKAVNDAHGHPAGDLLLRNVATAISTALRPYDIVTRWGGDEFVFAMPETTVQELLQRITIIQHHLAQRPTAASISAGHARLRPGDTLSTLIARADAALYVAKRSRER
ncbi:MAG TPA: GGDEF domain-containing protein [Conexibacter sp.]|nr:GGDEF domain-containing protein [Conexibacter sp.]